MYLEQYTLINLKIDCDTHNWFLLHDTAAEGPCFGDSLIFVNFTHLSSIFTINFKVLNGSILLVIYKKKFLKTANQSHVNQFIIAYLPLAIKIEFYDVNLSVAAKQYISKEGD